jgi:hypothetical protein
MTIYADNSRHASSWAAQIYAKARAGGRDHLHAVRILARVWTRVIYQSAPPTTPNCTEPPDDCNLQAPQPDVDTEVLWHISAESDGHHLSDGQQHLLVVS